MKPSRSNDPAEFVYLDGELVVADITRRAGNSITADLYRNLEDFQRGAVMESSVRLAL